MESTNSVQSSVIPEWQNTLDKEPTKIQEKQKKIEKIEYKGSQKVKKEIEVRAYTIKKEVTKGYLQRQNIVPFGIGKTEDDLRQNVNLSSIQRENVWHPYFEIKVEEEDFKEKYMKRKRELIQDEGGEVGKDILSILKKIMQIDQDEQKQREEEKEAGQEKKKTYDYKEILKRKQLEEEQFASIPVIDEETIKLRGLPGEITEEDIQNALQKFGKIRFVRVPMEDQNGPYAKKRKNRGFAFVTFMSKESAQRALEEKEVTIEFATIEIERAMKRPPQQQQSRGGYEFQQIKSRRY